MMRLFSGDKRGGWLSVFEFLPEALGFGVSLLVMIWFLSVFHSGISADPTIQNETVALGYSQGLRDDFPGAADFIMPIGVVVTLGFAWWSARREESSHVFAWVAFIAMVLFMLFGMFIETAWQEFTTGTALATYTSTIPITHFMLSNVRIVALVMCVIVGWALYARDK